MVNLVALRDANQRRYANAKLTRNFNTVARRLIEPSAKARYQAVAQRTGVPWAVIAVIHERESSQSWLGSLAQGDPWNHVSVHDPAGRGPFKSWEDAAVDALVNCAPYAARNKDWSIGGTLTKLEEYNGLGYAAGPSPTRGPNAGRHFPPQPAPYIWSGTDQYTHGKYVADHDFRPEVVDIQPGCANLLMTMMAMDASITFTGAVLTPAAPQSTPKPVQSTPSPPLVPSITNPAKGSIGALIAGLFSKLFGRKS